MCVPWRTSLVCVAALLLPAQARSPPPGNEQAPPVTLPTSDERQLELQQARDLVKGEKWADAVRLLQRVLETPEDRFVKVMRTGTDGKVRAVFAGAWAEA